MRSNIVRLMAVAVLLVCTSATQLHATISPCPLPLPPGPHPPLQGK
jgi:hypothetical protein